MISRHANDSTISVSSHLTRQEKHVSHCDVGILLCTVPDVEFARGWMRDFGLPSYESSDLKTKERLTVLRPSVFLMPACLIYYGASAERHKLKYFIILATSRVTVLNMGTVKSVSYIVFQQYQNTKTIC